MAEMTSDERDKAIQIIELENRFRHTAEEKRRGAILEQPDNQLSFLWKWVLVLAALGGSVLGVTRPNARSFRQE